MNSKKTGVNGSSIGARADAGGSGLYVGYAQRLGSVVSSVGVLVTLGLLATFDPVATTLILERPIQSLVLFALPPIGGIAAAISLAVSGNPEMLRGASEGAIPKRIVACCNILWWLCAVVPLAMYLSLLLVPPMTLEPDQIVGLAALLLSYWLAASAVSVALFRAPERFVFFGAVLVLLLTLPLRFGIANPPEYYATVLYRFSFVLPVLVTFSALLVRSRQLDELREERRAVEEQMVAERTAITARRRTNEFVHDHVLSVLTAFSMYPSNTEELQRAAQNATEVMRGRLAGEPLETVGSLANILAREHPFVDIACPTTFQDFPIGPAASALYAATMEAVSNAVRHGRGKDGKTPNIQVSFNVSQNILEVRIRDDGCGFDGADDTKSGRFGIEHGIRERMEEAYGSASIVSAIGEGTLVTLSWPARKAKEETLAQTPAQSRLRAGLGDSLASPAARLLAATLAATVLAIVLIMREGYSSLFPSLITLAAYTAAAYTLVLRKWPAGKVPVWAAWTVAICVAAGNYWVLSSAVDPQEIDHVAWTLGAGTLLACGLLMRRHLWIAWAIVGLLIVSSVLWALSRSEPWQLGAGLGVGQVTTLGFWTVMVLWSTMAVHELTLSDRVSQQISAERKVNEGVRKAVTQSLRSVANRSSALIEPIANGGPLTEELRIQARILEADLRDDIRASSLARSPVADSARAARRRGVEVVLLDDSADGPIVSEVPEVMIKEAVRVLDSTDMGRVVVRLQPTGSGGIGTIVSPKERIDVLP